MATQITCVYTVQAVGSRVASTVQTQLASVPLSLSLPQQYGLRVISDATTNPAGNRLVRTIVLGMNPGTTASFTATVNQPGGPVSKIVINAFQNGLDYIKPPVIRITTPPAPGVQATAHSTLGVFDSTLVSAGTGYSATPTATFSGGYLAPGGAQATATVNTDGAGHLTTLTIVTRGGPYNVPATITITDATGSGGVFTARMGVSSIVLDNPGSGYGIGGAATTVTPLPFFKSQFPDAAGAAKQGAAVAEWMTYILQSALRMRVFASAPVVA